MPTGRPGRTHGIVSTYIWGCRCESCRLAGSRYYYQHTLEEWRAKTEAQHGTESRYTGHGCGCADCKAAAAAARKRRRRENGPGPTARHGTNSTYANGCRCGDCRQAHTVYTRERRAAKRAKEGTA